MDSKGLAQLVLDLAWAWGSHRLVHYTVGSLADSDLDLDMVCPFGLTALGRADMAIDFGSKPRKVREELLGNRRFGMAAVALVCRLRVQNWRLVATLADLMPRAMIKKAAFDEMNFEKQKPLY
jgi:hypothetical protein